MIASYGADGLWSRQSCSITSRPFRGILRIKFACDGLSVSPTAFSTPQWSDNLRSSAPHPHPMLECGGRACVVGHPTNYRQLRIGRTSKRDRDRGPIERTLRPYRNVKE